MQFEQVRSLVRHGMPDPLGLAVASFGEEARGAWRKGEVVHAVNLYARQASYKSESGENSLMAIADLILKDDDLLDRGIQDDTTRRLLFICLNANSGRRFFIGPDPDGTAESTVDRVVAALERHSARRVPGAALLASAAYFKGRFDVAEKLIAMEDSPMSSWVAAKLALRKGDRAAALQAYARALKSLQASRGTVSDIRPEIGVLSVSRGEYVQALDMFYHSTQDGLTVANEWSGFADYWGDTAYLAERVLTIAELQKYIDHNVSGSHGSSSKDESLSSRLRSILARRLMRAGQRGEALRYFDDRKIRDAAKEYDDALDRASGWWRLKRTKSEALFRAAKLAREHGMELLGFEKEPDYAMWNGEFTLSDSDYLPARVRDQQKSANLYELGDERRRVAASKPERDVRFQYRLTAADHAMKSADLLPKSSQAFAAVLCEATHWTILRQPEEAAQIYRRYLKEGAYVPWGRSFGQQCPEPNFIEASSWSPISRKAKHLVKRSRSHTVYIGLMAVAALAISVVFVYFGRIRRLGHNH